MTTPHLTAQLKHVVQAASLAPSVHNTQPWRFVLRGDGFDLHAEPHRALPVLDPDGRQLHLSCGAALITARVAARALGLDASVQLLPEPQEPALLARLTLTHGPSPDDAELCLALAVLRRHTVRTAFEDRPLPDLLLEDLRRAAESEGSMLRQVRAGEERTALAVLLSAASAAEERDPAYREEVTAWVRDAASGDGIPPAALPPAQVRGSSLRPRVFTFTAPLPSGGTTPAAEEPDVVVLSTPGDDRRAWLQAGQALGAVLLHAAAAGVQAQPLGQVTDRPGPRRALAQALGLVGAPQLVLRMGYATPQAATPRRELDDLVATA